MKIAQSIGVTGLGIAALLAIAACSPSPTPNTSPQATAPASAPAPTPVGQGAHTHDHAMHMELGPADSEYDLRFIDGMILHHQGAVDMAEDARQKSQRPEIQQLAQNIIAAQQTEIQQMQQWRQTWYPQAEAAPQAYNPTTRRTEAMSPAQTQAMMMSPNLGEPGPEYDLRFINAMIPHHEGALFMAEDARQKSQRPEIQTLAQEIVSAQQAEISQMQQWRKAWYQQ